MSNEIKNTFKEVTGCKDEKMIEQILKSAENNLEKAINNFYTQSFRNNMDGDDVDEPGPSTSHNTRRLRTRKRQQLPQNKEITEINLSDEENMYTSKKRFNDDESVRAPIAPVQGPIIEQSFRESYAAGLKRKQTNDIFEQYHDFHNALPTSSVEAPRRIARMPKIEGANTDIVEINNEVAYSDALNGTRNRNNISTDTGKNLKALFRPPMEIIYKGDWDAARREAQRRSLWLLVNLQNATEFSCQVLNRDLWSNSTVKEVIQPNFLFWQVYNDSPDGVRVSNYYSRDAFPAVFIVDPRTGEEVHQMSLLDPLSFMDQVTAFLDKCPTFEARDDLIHNLNAMPLNVRY